MRGWAASPAACICRLTGRSSSCRAVTRVPRNVLLLPAPFPLEQHVLSVFRTQRVEKILFDLSTVTCKATITLHCENGGCWLCLTPVVGWLQHAAMALAWQAGAAGLVGVRRFLCYFTALACPRAGLTKSYKLPTMDSEILQATVDKQQFAVRLTAETAAISRLLARWVGAAANAVGPAGWMDAAAGLLGDWSASLVWYGVESTPCLSCSMPAWPLTK